MGARKVTFAGQPSRSLSAVVAFASLNHPACCAAAFMKEAPAGTAEASHQKGRRVLRRGGPTARSGYSGWRAAGTATRGSGQQMFKAGELWSPMAACLCSDIPAAEFCHAPWL